MNLEYKLLSELLESLPSYKKYSNIKLIEITDSKIFKDEKARISYT
jgi:hypothetical protein